MKRPNRVVGMELPPPFSQADGNLPPSLVSKDFGCRSPLDKVLSPLSESKGLRSFRIGKTLYQNGVSTPRPIAAWEIRRWGFVQASFYLYEEVSEATLVRQLLKDHPKRDKQLSPVLEDLAKLVRGMHDSGIFHRDLTLGNFLATAESRGRGNSRVSII
ncbi:MAG TPA: lipopolysaccharide kinase InaA family protein, partial [Nitrospiria bacterium]